MYQYISTRIRFLVFSIESYGPMGWIHSDGVPLYSACRHNREFPGLSKIALLVELSDSTMLLLDEPTDNLDLASAESLEQALGRYEGTVVSVTHDRWFTRGFTRYLIFGANGKVYESPEPIFEH